MSGGSRPIVIPEATPGTKKLAARAALLLVLLAAAWPARGAAGGAFAASAAPAASTDAAKEYEVKAAFLYHFARYTTWPESAFEKPESPFVIAVVGTDPFGAALETAFKAKKFGSREIAIARFEKSDAIGKAHVLFCASNDEQQVAEIAKACAGKAVLIVGDQPGLAAKGATAAFFLDKANVKFEINSEAVKRAGLFISSQLLKLARIVEDNK